MIAFIVGMSLLFAQTPGPARVGHGVVTGRIGSADGSAASGLRVAAMTVDGSTQLLSSLALTDAAGNYRLEDIPPGRYYVVAGSLDSPTFYPGVGNRAAAWMVTVTAAGATTGVDFNFQRMPGVSGQLVSGRIVGLAPSITPVLSIRLWRPVESRTTNRTARVDIDGSFVLRDIPSGDYTMNLLNGAVPIVTAMIHVEDFDVRGIELAAPQIVSGHFELHGGQPLPTPKEEGPIDPNLQGWKRPLFGINLELRGIHAKGTCSECLFNAVADLDGSFKLTLPVGEYDVFVNRLPLGYESHSVNYGDVDVLKAPLKIGRQTVSQDLRVTVTPASSGVKVSGVVAGVDLETIMPRWAILTTQVTDGQSPIRNIASQAPIQKDGTFEFLHVPAGRATIEIVPVIPNLFSVTVDVVDRDLSGVELRPPPPALEVDLLGLPLIGNDPIALITTLPGYRAQPLGHTFPSECTTCTGPIAGRLTGEAPLPKTIRLIDPSGKAFEAPVNAEGRFDFVNLLSVPYDMQVSLPILVPVRLPRLTIGARIIEIPIPPLRTIGGRVLLEGSNAEDWKQMLVRVNGEASVPIEKNGRFTLPLAEGIYTLWVTNVPDRYVVKSITYGKADVRQTPLQVSDPPTAEIVITLAPRR